MHDPLASFRETAVRWGCPPDERQQQQFTQYLAFLMEWNERINLTAVRDPVEIGRRHFLDALRLLPFLPPTSFALMDVGSGAGFPGVPLKIMRPDMRLVLVESVGKKGNFLQQLLAELKLERSTVLIARAEELGRDGRHRERYQVVTARAVAELRVLVEYLLPLTAVGGVVLALKGSQAAREIADAAAAVDLLGGGGAELHNLPPVDGDESGVLVRIEKERETPAKYPRRVGVPGKRPL